MQPHDGTVQQQKSLSPPEQPNDHQYHHRMRERLLNIVGLAPSHSWLNECTVATSSNEEQLFEQVLHHDLRSVVDRENLSAAARQLRASVTSSQNSNSSCLPDSFRLLVQVESFSDMSVGLEKRLDRPSAHKRCLRMAYTDGYRYNDNDDTVFTSMEVAPLTDMRLDAGIKVLMKGPLTIRNGIIGWTPSNAIVLGGMVDELVQLQQQAIQRAKQRAGHGVDPTIKALIWNNQNVDEQEDESERASEDVASHRAPVHPPPTRNPQTTRQQVQSIPPSATSRRTPHPTQPSAPIPTARAQAPPERIALPSQQPSGSMRPPGRVSPLPPPTTTTTSTPLHHTTNPYAHPVSVSRSTVLPTNPPVMATPLNTAATRNPYATLSSQSSSTSTLSPTTRPAIVATLPFEQLRHTLQRALSDAEMRRHMSSQLFITQLAQEGVHTNFNICKTKGVGGGNKKCYQYVLDAKFRGPNETGGGLMTCRVASAILEPLFSIPPGELRTLNKQDKPRANQLVAEGGVAVQREMKKLRSYQVSVLLESSASALDGPDPILCLLQVT